MSSNQERILGLGRQRACRAVGCSTHINNLAWHPAPVILELGTWRQEDSWDWDLLISQCSQTYELQNWFHEKSKIKVEVIEEDIRHPSLASIASIA